MENIAKFEQSKNNIFEIVYKCLKKTFLFLHYAQYELVFYEY
jgi:hypothetical protein